MLNPKLRFSLHLFFYFLLALAFYSFIIPDVLRFDVPSLYQARDIHRALALYFTPEWIWHGPDLSGGGYLPGPFYYWLIGLPFWIFHSLGSIIYFEFILAALGLVVLLNFLRKKFSEMAAIFFFFYFISSLFFLNTLSDFWNPSFLFLFFALSFVLLYENSSKPKLALGAFILGLALQVHYISLILLLTALLNIGLTKEFKKEKLVKLLLVLFFALLPQLPYYFIFKANSSGSFANSQAGLSTFFVHLKMMLADPKAFTQYFTRELFFLPLLLLALLFRKKYYSEKIRFILLGLAVSSLLLLWLMHGLYLSRYAIPFFLFAGLFASIFAAELLPQHKKLSTCMLALIGASLLYKIYSTPLAAPALSQDVFISLAVVLLLSGVLLTLIKERKSRLTFSLLLAITLFQLTINKTQLTGIEVKRYAYSGGLSLREAPGLIKQIYTETGWSYTYFREHSYIQGLDRERDLSLMYELVTDKKYSSLVWPDTFEKYDGLIMSPIEGAEERPLLLQRALEQKDISCKKTLLSENFKICLYVFAPGKEILKWNNVGYAYLAQNNPAFTVSKSSGVQMLSEKEAVLYMNSCDSLENSCSVFFRLKLLPARQLYVEITGDPLASVDNAVNPAWVLGFSGGPHLTVECEGKNNEIVLTENLGFSNYRNSFLAPFENIYSLPCEHPGSIRFELGHFMSFYNNYSQRPIGQKQDLVWTL